MSLEPEYILLRLGELTLKGRNRFRFENQVLSQVQHILQAFDKTKVTRNFGRIYIELNGAPYKPIAVQLGYVFGLNSYSPVKRSALNLQEIRNVALALMRGIKPSRGEESNIPKTFKVSTRRPNRNFEYDSRELNRLVGGYILEHSNDLSVNVHHPDTELRIEIREEWAYIFVEVISGLGGFPLGSNGKAMLMLSGGIDSPVAGWLAMRRGVEIEAVHFHSFPYTSERAKLKVLNISKQLTLYSSNIKLHLVPFTEIQTKLQQHVQENLMITLMKRAMVQITEKLAYREGANAIVTGESLGQVASQTLSSLNVIGRVTELPIIQPLITMDKNEIIAMANRIGTFPISILPYEDCCTLFQSKSPSTNPNLNIVQKFERKMTWLNDLIMESVEHTETQWITQEDSGEIDSLFY